VAHSRIAADEPFYPRHPCNEWNGKWVKRFEQFLQTLPQTEQDKIVQATEYLAMQVSQTDCTNMIEQVKMEEGTVQLDPDVRAWFPDSASVNQALCALIMLMEQMPTKGKKKKSPKATPVSA